VPDELDVADGPEDDPVRWLARFSASLGVEPPDAETLATLLDLAGVAAHASQRTAAPIACYLVGQAGLDPSTALARAREV
jgi:Domain of unknown function (DUF6457)